MLINKAEMEALRIVSEYMDAPAEIFKNMEDESLDDMLVRGYLKHNRELSSLRLTEDGAEILQRAGIEAKEYVSQSKKRVLVRRHQGAKVAMFLREAGVDVFLKEKPLEITEPVYISAAEIRRHGKRNVLGRAKFIGLLYTSKVTYAVYDVSSPDERIYPLTEHDIFKRERIRVNNPEKVMYIADCDLSQMTQAYVTSPPAEIVEDAPTPADFYQAIDLFPAPVCFAPIDTIGSIQLKIMLTENYREKLARYMLNVSYHSPPADFVDAAFKGGFLLVFIDFDVKRLENALGATDKLSILIFKQQEPALETLLRDRQAKIAYITPKEAFEALQIPPPKNWQLNQFTNEKGDGVYAKRFNKNRD